MTERFECGVCWWVYDPREGDTARQIPSGTAFEALPPDWTCPKCDTDGSLFLSLDAGTQNTSENAARARQVGASSNGDLERLRDARLRGLLDDYREIMDREMAGLPIINPKLDVSAIGFAPFAEGQLGIVVTPWLMSAVIVPDERDDLRSMGQTVMRALPSGAFEFSVVRLHRTGAIESLSLLSPVDVLKEMDVAREAARAALGELLGTQDEAGPRLSRRALFGRSLGRDR